MSTSPVGEQLVGDKTTWNLSYNVAPEEGSMDQSHCLRVPVKLSFLERKKITLMILYSFINPSHGFYFLQYIKKDVYQESVIDGCGLTGLPEEQGSR